MTPVASISAKRNADGTVTLTWTGTLESSDTLNGTFLPLVGATSPATLTPEVASRFFRVR